jgi:hypothetical protein
MEQRQVTVDTAAPLEVLQSALTQAGYPSEQLSA